MTRPTHCPSCGGRLALDLARKTMFWRRTGFSARIPSSCVDCSTQLLLDQHYVDGDRLHSWSVTVVAG
jgi:primosomal protein N'